MYLILIYQRRRPVMFYPSSKFIANFAIIGLILLNCIAITPAVYAIPSTYLSICKNEIIPLATYKEAQLNYDSVDWYPRYFLSSYNTRNPNFIGASDQCYLRTLYYKNTIIQEDNFCIFVIDTTNSKFSYETKICVGNILSCGVVINPAVKFTSWNMFPNKGNFLGKSYDTNAVEVKFNDSGIVTLRVNIVTSTKCTVTASIKVFVSPVDPSVICVYSTPVSTHGIAEYIKCPYNPITISVDTSANSVLWNTGETTHEIIVYKQGIYKATIINKFNCVTETPSVQIINKKSPILLTKTIDACRNIVILSAPTNYKSYLWNTGETTPSIIPPTRGKYWVIVEDTSYSWVNPEINPSCFICSDTINTLTTDVHQYKIIGGNPLCSTDVDTLTCNLQLKRKQWNTGQISDSLFVFIPGNYWFIGIDSNYCTVYSDTINITDLRPKIICTNFCNYDTVFIGDSKIKTFTFKNIGTMPDTLTYLSNLPKEIVCLTPLPIILQAGEVVNIDLRWTPTSEYNLFGAFYPRFLPCNSMARILIDGVSIRLFRPYSITIDNILVHDWFNPFYLNLNRISVNIKYPITITCTFSWVTNISWFIPEYDKNFTITNIYTINDSTYTDVTITDDGVRTTIGSLKFIPIVTRTNFTEINCNNIKVSSNNLVDKLTCSAGSILKPFVCSPFSIGTIPDVSVYPNPIQGAFKLVSSDGLFKDIKVTLFNLQGIVVKSWFNNITNIYTLDNIISGTYIIRLESTDYKIDKIIQIIQ